MSRIEKKTKIRYLPAKVQLTENSALTGSYPAVARTAGVDNRSGRAASFYSDVNTIVFSSASVPSFSPTDIPPNQFKMNPGQDLQPFYDSGQEAADGKSSTDPFWATGSNFDGLRSPLWSKHKIEIDITPVAQTAITAAFDSGYGAIYNFDTKQWNQGEQAVANEIYKGPDQYYKLNYGFSPSYHTKYNGRRGGGQPFSNFGFPWSVQVATSSLFKMSNVIDKPFLIEKIYVQISASYVKGIDPTSFDDALDYEGASYYAGDNTPSDSFVFNNFYILNQRTDYKNGKNVFSTFEGDFSPERSYISLNPVNKTNDLVTWFNILSHNTNYGYTSSSFADIADVLIFDPDSSDSYFSSWSQNIHMSGATRIPNYGSTDAGILMIDAFDDTYIKYFLGTWQGGRNGTDAVTSNGRDFVNGVKSSNASRKDFTFSPYLVMPGDALSFNWQMPMPETVNGNPFNVNISPDSSYLIFAQHPAKVILYGTYLSENKETNETLNQVLSSDTVHEAL